MVGRFKVLEGDFNSLPADEKDIIKDGIRGARKLIGYQERVFRVGEEVRMRLSVFNHNKVCLVTVQTRKGVIKMQV